MTIEKIDELVYMLRRYKESLFGETFMLPMDSEEGIEEMIDYLEREKEIMQDNIDFCRWGALR